MLHGGAVPKLSVDRERVLRTLTFWLRPDFVLRVVNRFQRVAGFDRAVALASSSLTALIPLLIFTSAVLPRVGGETAADEIIERYDLEGSAADAVQAIFSPTSGTSTSIGIFGALFMLIAVMSFTRACQRLFEQTWELAPLSVRNSLNGLKWIGALVVYSAVTGTLRGLFNRGAIEILSAAGLIALSAGFMIWTGYILSAKRIPWRDLIAFGVVAAALLAAYSIGASIYVPVMFESYAERYGAIGVVFAMISALFAAMLVVVGSAALGREVHDELGRIRRGERPSEDEVRTQWNAVIAEARTRYQDAREWLDSKRREPGRRVLEASAEPAGPLGRGLRSTAFSPRESGRPRATVRRARVRFLPAAPRAATGFAAAGPRQTAARSRE